MAWLGISFAYKGSLQVIAVVMAFHIRRVKIKALNDSKKIAAIIYFNSIILVILVVTEFALQHYHDVYAALFGLALLIEASLFLGVLFIPKVCDPLSLFVMKYVFLIVYTYMEDHVLSEIAQRKHTVQRVHVQQHKIKKRNIN